MHPKPIPSQCLPPINITLTTTMILLSNPSTNTNNLSLQYQSQNHFSITLPLISMQYFSYFFKQLLYHSSMCNTAPNIKKCSHQYKSLSHVSAKLSFSLSLCVCVCMFMYVCLCVRVCMRVCVHGENVQRL